MVGRRAKIATLAAGARRRGWQRSRLRIDDCSSPGGRSTSRADSISRFNTTSPFGDIRYVYWSRGESHPLEVLDKHQHLLLKEGWKVSQKISPGLIGKRDSYLSSHQW